MSADWRLISVRQPWADAILTPGGKDVENRGAGFPKGWTGTLVVHAAQAWSDRGERDARIYELYRQPGDFEWRSMRALDRFPGGAILGLVDVDDVHLEHGGCCGPWGESQYQRADGTWARSVTHLVLSNPRRLARPIVYRGGLGLRHVPPAVVDAVTAQLMEEPRA